MLFASSLMVASSANSTTGESSTPHKVRTLFRHCKAKIDSPPALRNVSLALTFSAPRISTQTAANCFSVSVLGATKTSMIFVGSIHYTHYTRTELFNWNTLSMKFLLCQNLVYLPTHGGANKSNRMLLELLARDGHECVAVTPASGVQGPRTSDDMIRAVQSMGIQPRMDNEQVISYTSCHVEVRAVLDSKKLRAEFRSHIRAFVPDWVIISSEDTFYTLLAVAIDFGVPQIAYLARTTLLLPFGPDASFPDAASTERLKRVPRTLCVSAFIRDYFAKWAGIRATVVPLSFYGPGPFPQLGSFEQGFVTLINPCAVKGISLFLSLAQAMPGVQFAAVPTWGTTKADRDALAETPNVTILSASDDIDDIFVHTRVLLVPSLWAEGKGEVVIEAMLRGIPVLAADTGGLPEAKLGVDYVLPVNPITQYKFEYDERMVPVSTVPEQDIGPWKRALNRLLSDRDHYVNISRASREAALRYANTATVEPFLAALSSA